MPRRTQSRPRPAPAAPQSRSFSSQPSRSPPPPAPQQHAPPPAPQQQGGGMMSGIMGNVATGMAIGTGSAIAHRAVDGLWNSVTGGGSGQQQQEHSTQAYQQPMQQSGGPCEQQAKQFTECMTNTNGDMAACQFYFDAMQQCKRVGM